jgi:hypothetical protein
MSLGISGQILHPKKFRLIELWLQGSHLQKLKKFKQYELLLNF